MTGDVAVALRVSGDAARVSCGRRWCGPATPDDEAVLERAHAPVLDVGCGPGRHVLALARSGKVVLGIDLTAPAVSVARRRGAPVLHRSVFSRVPGAGRWRTALLLDGNIGIGGEPVGLLRRVASLLRPDGSVLVELDPPGVASVVTSARLELDGVTGPWFPWTRLSIDDIAAVAEASETALAGTWSDGIRWFAQLDVARARRGRP